MPFKRSGKHEAWPLHILFLLYRRLGSPLIHALLGPGYGCRFIPTCSCYAEEALSKHGLWKGGLLTLKRISRCHPFSKENQWEDPVPRSNIPSKRVISQPGTPAPLDGEPDSLHVK